MWKSAILLSAFHLHIQLAANDDDDDGDDDDVYIEERVSDEMNGCAVMTSPNDK